MVKLITMIMKVKKLGQPEPAAILVGAVIEILAALHVPQKLELTAEQVAQIGGALIMIAATIRMLLNRGSTQAPAEPVAQASSSTPDADPEPDEASNDEESETPVVGPPPSIGG